MKQMWKEIQINGKNEQALIIEKEDGDKEIIRNLYLKWKDLNETIKTISTRGINLPEVISENAFTLHFTEYVKVIKLKYKKCSFDCINTQTGLRTQLKATSTTSDLTSFGPRSEWDELYFLDFSSMDGKFKVYKIDSSWVYTLKTNKNQTFTNQQKQGKRPRLSIIKKIIEPRSLQPIRICQL